MGKKRRHVETRSLIPRDTPNGNDPATHPPGTVGPDAYTPGDPVGVAVTDVGSATPALPFPRPQPWSGWPAEWSTPGWWGRYHDLTDTAWACLDLNSGVLAAMPPYLVGAASSLDSAWMVNPDPDLYTSWSEFARQLFWDFQAVGEVFVLATARYGTGWPARFHVVEPWMINVEVGNDGLRRYSIGGRALDARDVLHVRYQGTASEAHGHGPLEAGRARLVAAGVLARYATNLAVSGGIPNAVLKHPDELTAEQAAELQAQWVNARMSSLGMPAVISGGLEFETLQMSPTDMALLDLSQWNESRIAVLLKVPPFLVGLPSGGDSMTYSNVNALFVYHWESGLKPWAARLMDALSFWALPASTTIELNRDEYIRPGPLERAQYYATMIGIGAMSAEQAAEIERLTIAAPTPTLTSGVLA